MIAIVPPTIAARIRSLLYATEALDPGRQQ
jgi:hypothetical protein